MKNIDPRLDRLGEALHGAAVADLDAVAAEAPATSFWRRRAPRLALGGAVALTAVAAALIVGASGGNTPSAYAVETQPGGGVKIEIFSLGEPEGVEQALEEAGIASQVTYLEAGMTCREPHYQPSMAMLRTLQGRPQPQPWAGFDYESIDGPLRIAIGDYRQRQEMAEEIRQAIRQGDSSGADWPSFVIDPTGFRPDQTLVMSGAPTPDGYKQPPPPQSDGQSGIKISGWPAPIDAVGQVRVAEGDVGPCQPVPAGNSPAPVRAPQGGWDFSEAPYAGWGFGPDFGAPDVAEASSSSKG
jgi:hypothetical protein